MTGAGSYASAAGSYGSGAGSVAGGPLLFKRGMAIMLDPAGALYAAIGAASLRSFIACGASSTAPTASARTG